MSRLLIIDRHNWEALVSSQAAVLMLGKSDCPACAAWTEELTSFLLDDQQWPAVVFGKLLLDTPGMVAFKRANPWIAEVDVLPFNVLYAHGERVNSFAGGGIDRLVNRMQRRFIDEAATVTTVATVPAGAES